MADQLFMIVLALLTLVAGAALSIMILRRRRQRRSLEEETTRAAARYGYGRPAPPRKRLIDEYTTPAAIESAAPSKPSLEDDVGKICPRCSARYGSHHRVCERDDAELAALN